MSAIEPPIRMPPIRRRRVKPKPAPVEAVIKSAPAPVEVALVDNDAQPATSPTPVSKRRFIGPQDVPECVPNWEKPKDRAVWLDYWRMAIVQKFAGSAVKVAWILEWLISFRTRHAFITDGALAKKTGLSVKKIQDALLDLERGGAIVRASVFIRNKPQRRIWPSTEILGGNHPKSGVSPTTLIRGKSTPQFGGGEYLVRETGFPRHRISATHEAARKDAWLREHAAARRQAAHSTEPSDDGEDQ